MKKNVQRCECVVALNVAVRHLICLLTVGF